MGAGFICYHPARADGSSALFRRVSRWDKALDEVSAAIPGDAIAGN
jgi:hypothetical protein